MVMQLALFAALLFFLTVFYSMGKRNVHLWIGGYLHSRWRAWKRTALSPVHIYFSIADHFEPYWSKSDQGKALDRVEGWCRRYPEIASKHQDSRGRRPQHTFFFPMEEYDEMLIEPLAKLCHDGYGDIELHLHHDQDNGSDLRERIDKYISKMHDKHALFRKNPETGRLMYGFIHGNWALDNSRRDGRFCGVNNEISVLLETGCYADFTLPSAPSDTQTRKVNSIYFAKDDPEKPKSHDKGEDAVSGCWREDRLLMIQGPLGFNWKRRKFGIFPSIENGEVSADNPATPERIDLWVKHSARIQGIQNAIFIKIHTHGAQETNAELLLGENLDTIWNHLEHKYNDTEKYILNYVTAYQIYGEIKRRILFQTDTEIASNIGP
jgi:hypothetical protein